MARIIILLALLVTSYGKPKFGGFLVHYGEEEFLVTRGPPTESSHTNPIERLNNILNRTSRSPISQIDSPSQKPNSKLSELLKSELNDPALSALSHLPGFPLSKVSESSSKSDVSVNPASNGTSPSVPDLLTPGLNSSLPSSGNLSTPPGLNQSSSDGVSTASLPGLGTPGSTDPLSGIINKVGLGISTTNPESSSPITPSISGSTPDASTIKDGVTTPCPQNITTPSPALSPTGSDGSPLPSPSTPSVLSAPNLGISTQPSQLKPLSLPSGETSSTPSGLNVTSSDGLSTLSTTALGKPGAIDPLSGLITKDGLGIPTSSPESLSSTTPSTSGSTSDISAIKDGVTTPCPPNATTLSLPLSSPGLDITSLSSPTTPSGLSAPGDGSTPKTPSLDNLQSNSTDSSTQNPKLPDTEDSPKLPGLELLSKLRDLKHLSEKRSLEHLSKLHDHEHLAEQRRLEHLSKLHEHEHLSEQRRLEHLSKLHDLGHSSKLSDLRHSLKSKLSSLAHLPKPGKGLKFDESAAKETSSAEAHKSSSEETHHSESEEEISEFIKKTESIFGDE